ncbi:MAG TPA: winged helix-turn-helix domain-containing protein [Candidatus Thermoplasmatota archaeon]|nr:winged helix-turn-helix domain-containing protein [Candidatus Thermoplasmatota archaeon]
MVRITLDAETFKALASPTRLTVLRALDERRKTLTEISRDLDLNKATVHEHLALLTAAELVKKRDDEGRKWIYYELTWRGQKLLHPQETTTFNVLLGLSIAAAGGGLGLLANALMRAADQSLPGLAGEPEAPTLAAGTVSDAGKGAAPAAASSTGSSTQTASSAPSSTASGSSTATSTGEQGAQGVAASTGSGDALQDDAFAGKSLAAPSDPPGMDFFDEGGAIAIALLAAGLLFGLLSWLLRRRIRPGPFQPPPGPPEP